jgi:hypothetical protein
MSRSNLVAAAVSAAAIVIALLPVSPAVARDPNATNTPTATNTRPPTNTPTAVRTPTASNTVAASATLTGAELTGTAQANVAATQAAIGATFTAAAIVGTFVAQGTAAASSTAAAALTATAAAPTDTPFPTDTPYPTDTPNATVTTTATPNPTTPHDARYFSQTGFRIDDDTFWSYFNIRGGLDTFGYPTSREFLFQGFQTQFFQRRIMQLTPDGKPRLLNLFDGGLFPYTNVNGSTFPAADSGLVGSAPQLGSPTYAADVMRFVQQNVPDSFNGKQVNFLTAFNNTVTLAEAFPSGNPNPDLLPGFNLEMWGVPTSHPAPDPSNGNFIYQRFQRGIMMYDAASKGTQAVLLADYFKAIITGVNVPPDLASAASQSPFYNQYNDSQPNGLNQPGQLPNTNMQFAFDPE